MKPLNYDHMYYHKEIRVLSDDGREVDFDIELKDWHGTPDCRIGNFYHNVWFRTPKGIKGETYKTEKSLELAVEKVIKNKGIRIVKWVEKGE